MPTQTFEYSVWSSTRIKTSPTTTTTAVAVTFTPAAVITDGGWRRKRDMPRSISFGRTTRGMSLRSLEAHAIYRHTVSSGSPQGT
jgi:hypothetical protein